MIGPTGKVALYTSSGTEITGVDVWIMTEYDPENIHNAANALHVGVPASYLELLAGQSIKLSVYPGAIVNTEGPFLLRVFLCL